MIKTNNIEHLDEVKSSGLPDFSNHSIAFTSKNNLELKKTRLLFYLLNINWLNNFSSFLATIALRLRLPINFIIRSSIFQQFCGGEDLKETSKTIDKLAKYNVKTSLDYSVEGKKREKDFSRTYKELLHIIDFSSDNDNINFASLKVTGLGKISFLISFNEGKKLTRIEKHHLEKVKYRLDRICANASSKDFNIFIDAEESWYQDGIDELATQMMKKYNKKRTNIYNTIQLYRKDRLDFLKEAHIKAKQEGYSLGLKLVRGAYMEKENEYWADKKPPSIIHDSKKDTDKAYNDAIKYCINNLNNISFCAATHNAKSSLLVTSLMSELEIPKNSPNIHFSQLYGMSDHITYNLAYHGYNVSKYLPYGPIIDVIPYLIRRAKENSAISGQMSRELSLIYKETIRRKNNIK
jgi:proline dehydrogenase